MKTYRAAVIGCSRMGGFIDDEVIGRSDIILPYSHAAGYQAVERTEVVACSDVREEAMTRFGERYGVSQERQYLDYKELIKAEQPDIVSIATQPEQRAEIILYACEQGVKAIYCEKPLCASMEEAEAITEAVKRHGVFLNMGTNRRWHPGYAMMREMIESGELGPLRAVISYSTGTLFNTGSHTFDVLQLLSGEAAPVWVQGHLAEDDAIFDGDVLTKDPSGQLAMEFENGVAGYSLRTPRSVEFEAVCAQGTIAAHRNGSRIVVRRMPTDVPKRERALGNEEELPFDLTSATVRLIEDLVHSLDTGNPGRGGVDVARTNTEIIFACIESHRRGGARVELPLKESKVRFNRF